MSGDGLWSGLQNGLRSGLQNELLSGLLAASLSAAVIILTVLFLRTLFQSRTPRRLFCLLWDAALARLLVLSALPSPVSVWRLLPESLSAKTSGVSHTVTPGVTAPAVQAVTEGGAAVPNLVPLPPVSFLDNGGAAVWVTAVWLAVALALAAWFFRGHLHSRRVYADSLPCGDIFVQDWLRAHPLRRRILVRTSDRIAAPLTYGSLHPVVLLPSGISWRDRAALWCILEHEFQHIRHFDTLRKMLLAVVLCLHWFNPLVWVMYVLCNRDMELACDEAVTAHGADRADYARTLLDMEEQRGQWGLSGSHFSQNALEERIRYIMKHKRTSIAGLAAVLGIMSISVTAFATAAPNPKAETVSGQNAPETGYVYDHFQAVEGEVMILSQGGEDGAKQYSVDGGRTWLTQEDYQANYGGSDWQVEWWTAEDYEVWLKEEKQVLQSIIGERGYTSGEGWFTWDQARVDEAVALYESILENIKNGALYSKKITDKNGGVVEDAVLGSGTLNVAEIFTFEEKDAAAPEAVDGAALLKELGAFGVDGDTERMTYNGQLIRCFVDGVPVGDSGYSIRYVYTNPEGMVDVHTLRSVICNPDGSYDPMGDLIGVAAKGDQDFDQGLMECAAFSGVNQSATAEGSENGSGMTFEEIFAQYRTYGLVYSPRENSMGSLTWNGQTVKSFADLKPDGGAFSYQDPYAERGLRVYTEYDADGNLTGLCAE